MDKKKYTMMMTQDGSIDGQMIVSRSVESDFLPQVGENVLIRRGRTGCFGEVTQIYHTAAEDGSCLVYVVCRFTGASAREVL